MRAVLKKIYRSALAGLFLVVALSMSATAYAACMSFAAARQAGILAKYNLKPAATVKSSVESRSGGKVLSIEVCEPGPTYMVTVARPDGVVSRIEVPAR